MVPTEHPRPVAAVMDGILGALPPHRFVASAGKKRILLALILLLSLLVDTYWSLPLGHGVVGHFC